MKVHEVFKSFMENNWSAEYGIRGNCGLAAIYLVDFFKAHNIESERIKGHFKCDIPVHDKEDFTAAMKFEFRQSGLDFNNPKDRLNWIKESSYFQEWLLCPHYWVEVDGEIFDPSGKAQFIDTGLSLSLDIHRYLYI